MKQFIIKDGWGSAGRQGKILGTPFNVNGMEWTPILWDGDEDPDWYKADGLEILSEIKLRTMVVAKKNKEVIKEFKERLEKGEVGIMIVEDPQYSLDKEK